MVQQNLKGSNYDLTDDLLFLALKLMAYVEPSWDRDNC